MKFTVSMILHPGYVPTGSELWKIISNGPEIGRPKSANRFEPLKNIEKIDVNKVCKNEFIWRNGRRCLGMYDPNGWGGRSELALLLEYPSQKHEEIIDEVQNFIHTNFKCRLIYGVEPNKKLLKTNLEVHQLANCGAIPPDESIIISNYKLFEIYEENA